MIVTIIQGLWKEGIKKKIVVKVLVAMWHSKNSDCVLIPHAYLHWILEMHFFHFAMGKKTKKRCLNLEEKSWIPLVNL
jgi:hypothetical protein